MASVQIDEADLLAQQNVVRVVNTMLANPEARKLLLKARKTSDPNAVIPEIDAAAPLNATIDEVKRMLAEEREARLAEKAERDQAARLQEFTSGWERQKRVLREQGWFEDGIAQVEKHAQERGIPDLEVTAAHYEKLHPPSAPEAPAGSGSWGFFDHPGAEEDTFLKAMIESRGEDESALNREINATLKDFRSQQTATRRY